MVMNPNDAEIINDLLAVCYEGEAFYREAVEYTQVQAMQPVFHQMAAIKAEIINDLKPCISAVDLNHQRNVMLIYGIQQSYKSIKAELAGGDERQAVARIQVLEQCVLNLMQDALEKVKTAAVQDLLKIWHVTATAAYMVLRNEAPLMAA
jgi:uncharacterized protein (TIGR02284 family)